MASKKRTYSRFTHEALLLLGKQIKLARKERGMSEKDLSARVGIARSTLQKIERADPVVENNVVPPLHNSLSLCGVSKLWQ